MPGISDEDSLHFSIAVSPIFVEVLDYSLYATYVKMGGIEPYYIYFWSEFDFINLLKFSVCDSSSLWSGS